MFGEIAVEVEECRAEVMSMYLMDNEEILALFGHDDASPITADEFQSSKIPRQHSMGHSDKSAYSTIPFL